MNLCLNTRQLPESLGRCTSIEILEAKYCLNLESFPESLSNLQKLRFFNFSYCSLIEEVPLGHCPDL